MALSYFIEQAELLSAAGRYLEWLVPGQSAAIVTEVGHFLENRDAVGGVLLVSMLFFSSLAFTVLENAMCVIFMHRVMVKRRHFLVSAFLPYIYILSLGIGMLLITLVSGALQVLGDGGVRHRATLKALLDAGASVALADREGRTPLELARARGYGEMVRMLEAVKRP